MTKNVFVRKRKKIIIRKLKERKQKRIQIIKLNVISSCVKYLT